MQEIRETGLMKNPSMPIGGVYLSIYSSVSGLLGFNTPRMFRHTQWNKMHINYAKLFSVEFIEIQVFLLP
jgi:hypothetical protein